jgi:hypothetical protein
MRLTAESEGTTADGDIADVLEDCGWSVKQIAVQIAVMTTAAAME